MQALSYDQTKSYSEGDFIELGGSYYKLTGECDCFCRRRDGRKQLVGNHRWRGPSFDGSVKVIEDPNWQFVESNGSFKISEAFRISAFRL